MVNMYIYMDYKQNGMEYYRHIKKEIMSFAASWMDLEDLILSEVKSKRERQIYDYLRVKSKIQYK